MTPNQPATTSEAKCAHQWDDASTDARGGEMRCRRCRVVAASISVIEEQAEEIARLRARAEAADAAHVLIETLRRGGETSATIAPLIRAYDAAKSAVEKVSAT